MVVENYGSNNNLKGDNESGIPIMIWNYNSDGLLIEKINFGTNHELIQDKKGIAIKRYEYDLINGKLTEVTLYDKSGQLLESEKGISILQYEYDLIFNQLIEIRTLDKNKKLKNDGFLRKKSIAILKTGN